MSGGVALLGGTGYLGEAFARELDLRGWKHTLLTRRKLDYTRFETLLAWLHETRPEFLVNAAGYTGKPNVDACETARAETLQGNALFPQTVAHACAATGTPWGHVSSGCIYTGAKLRTDAGTRIETDLTKPDVRALIERRLSVVHGFTETEPPNFSFRAPPCSFYSGTKALGEEAITGIGECFIWRPRIPFDEHDNPRNYLTKLQRYPKAYDNTNSISHRGDFARACLDLWQKRAPFGIYNVTNPGFVTTRQVVAKIEMILHPGRKFEFWANDEEFYRQAAKAPRSNCVLDTSKLLATGVPMRPVEEALEDALTNWKK
jgi:dTDP-4-dehydrorhamnose reductase